MFSKLYSAQVDLLKASLVSVETDLSKGLHSFSIVGLASKAVDEAKDRVSSAIKNTGFKSPKVKNQKIIVSLAPADIKKDGPLFDLPIALGYLLATGDIEFDAKDRLFIGELSLDGKVCKVKGVLPIVSFAKKSGFKEVYIPKDNLEEASLISGIDIFPVESLFDVVAHLNIKKNKKTEVDPKEFVVPSKKILKASSKDLNLKKQQNDEDNENDFSFIKGQEVAKRALQIACAGGHNIVLYGPPGTGKTMLARSVLSILPDLSEEDVFEVTSIYSVYEGLHSGIISRPPFRNPHHSSSYVSIVGGGSSVRPGEVTLSHKGVLFLDEMPEFDLKALEALREPLEEGKIRISRAKGSSIFPANFLLIGAMNPCPCGFYGVSGKDCKCSAISIEKYRRKLSGPIVDRIDLWVEVSSIGFDKIIDKSLSESSYKIKEKVLKARQEQLKRKEVFGVSLNKDLKTKDLQNFKLDDGCQKVLKDAVLKFGLSTRSYYKLLKISRTIADLDQSSVIKMGHIMEALQYRRKQDF